MFGDGCPHAWVMCIGEAPGAQEDIEGRPFVGRSGKLLRKMLSAIGLTAENDYYIANILKHRPPQNRPPEDDEIEQCLPFLLKQIEIIRPQMLLLLGKTAVRGLIPKYKQFRIDQLRDMTKDLGEIQYEGIPVMITYHPSALLRFPAHRKKASVDFRYLEAIKIQESEYDSLL